MKIKKFKSVGKEEINAAKNVIKSGVLSDFIGKKGDKFLGGKKVQEFEKKICKFYNTKYAIVTNSWTSGLICALGAINLEPGDEVICSPWTMSASAISILHWNAIPVLVDINYNNFQLDIDQLKRKITKKTKAIMAVDIFGQSENIKELKKISKKYNLKIISDSAQSPYSFLKGKLAGTMTDIGGYSLNCHKHINTGEGGILVTNNGKFAKKLRLIRNHAESCVDNKTPIKDLSNMLGYNFRLGEIESAIGIEQLKKLPKIVKYRQQLANVFTQNLKSLKNLNLPKIEKNNTHSYYVYPLILKDKISKKRKKIIYELRKLGVPGLMEGYINLAKLPIFQKKIAYGTKGFPWKYFNSKVSYSLNNFKNAEKLNKESFIGILLCSYDYKISDMRIIARKFNRVWEKLNLNNE
jgi:perosamine synthetase